MADCTLPELGEAQFGVLCGAAGTGKTTIARGWLNEGGTVLAATTGIAAVNLGAGIVTINALLRYFKTPDLEDAFIGGGLTTRLRKLRRSGIHRIVIDELSMLDGDQLTILSQAIREANGLDPIVDDGWTDEDAGETADDDQPLGLLLVGDFCQLPPIKAPFAFESPAWPQYAAHTHRLTHIYRQEDREFLDALHAARRGEPDAVVEYLSPHLERRLDSSYDGTTLMARNNPVDRYNVLRLSRLHTPAYRFPTQSWLADGHRPPGEWRQIPETLVLKRDALVMILANRYVAVGDGERRLLYANGDLGWLREVDEDGSVLVELQRTGQVVTVEWVTRQHTIPLEPGRRAALRAQGLAERIVGRREVVGELTYLPLRVAYASTIHKAQGLTLDRCQIQLGDGFFRSPGMLYVALSRARTGEGLRVVGSPQQLATRCVVDERVRGWV